MSDRAAALSIVGARWALLVVERLLDGPQRYGDLQRDLGVPTNILATRLRELEAAACPVLSALRHNTRAYALTDRGLALREAIVALGRWGKENAQASGRFAAILLTISDPECTARGRACPTLIALVRIAGSEHDASARHARQVRLRQSRQVCFPQVSVLRQSEPVALGLMKSGVVVTCKSLVLRSSPSIGAVVYGRAR